MSKTRHRRVFATIHLGHILDDEYLQMAKKTDSYETTLNIFFQEIKRIRHPKLVRALAMSLEVGSDTKRVHIQIYMELKQARSWDWYGNYFGVMSTCFQKVRDAPGAWRYCTGQDGEKTGILETWSFGDPVLHGSSESKADLKRCVSYIVDGYHPTMILRDYPYAYTVHRQRIWALWHDLQELEKTGTVKGHLPKS